VFSDQNDFSESLALARNVPSVFIWDVLAQNLEIVTIEKRVFRYRLGHGFCLCFGVAFGSLSILRWFSFMHNPGTQKTPAIADRGFAYLALGCATQLNSDSQKVGFSARFATLRSFLDGTGLPPCFA
jgi:hypothetical protein